MGGYNGPATGPVQSVISEGNVMPGGTGYDDTYEPAPMEMNGPAGQTIPDSMSLPPANSMEEPLPPQSSIGSPRSSYAERQARLPATGRDYTVPRQYSPDRARFSCAMPPARITRKPGANRPILRPGRAASSVQLDTTPNKRRATFSM